MISCLVFVCMEFDHQYFIISNSSHWQLILNFMIDDMVGFLVKMWVCKRNRVTGHLLENPVNYSMKCTEATLFEITLFWNPQYCKWKKKNIVPWADEREKHTHPPPADSLPACLLLLVSSTPFFGIYLEYERIEVTPGLTDIVLLY